MLSKIFGLEDEVKNRECHTSRHFVIYIILPVLTVSWSSRSGGETVDGRVMLRMWTGYDATFSE
jgi:hypothetical protein